MYIHPLLSSLAQPVRKAVGDASTLHSFRKGEVVLDAGQESENTYCVASGLIRVVSAGSSEADLTTNFLKPDDIHIGTGLCSAEHFVSDVRLVAALPSSLYIVPRRHLRKLCETYPQVALQLLDMKITRIGSMRRQMRRIATLSAEQIVTHVLHDLVQRGVDGKRAIDKRIPQSVIASYAGLSRPMVNKVFKELEERGLIHRDEGELVLSDRVGASTDFNSLGPERRRGERRAVRADEQAYAAADLRIDFGAERSKLAGCREQAGTIRGASVN